MRAILAPVRVLIYTVLILVSIPFFWQTFTGGTAMQVTSSSMVPTYQPGDVVFVQKVTNPPEGFWHKGDIVAVAFSEADLDKNQYIHRVERVLDNDRAVLKGDGNPNEDVSPVTLTQVVGTPVFVLHHPIADVFVFSQTWTGRLVIFGVALLILILVETLAKRSKPHNRAEQLQDI